MSFQILLGAATKTSNDVAQSQVEEGKIKIYKYDKQDQQHCCQCKLTKLPKYYFLNKDQVLFYICDDKCLTILNNVKIKETHFKDETPAPIAFVKKCYFCGKEADNDVETTLDWELMSFCNEFCLLNYQRLIGSKCLSCQKDVKSSALGKYSVRSGNKILQFCSGSCLELHKKYHKICPFCQENTENSENDFFGAVGETRQFIRFCSNICWKKFDSLNRGEPSFPLEAKCFVCESKETTIEFKHDKSSHHYFCGKPCFVAFTFVSKISTEKCATCRRYFKKSIARTMYFDNIEYSFCSKSCKSFHVFSNRKIFACHHCKVKKYNFDLIKRKSKNEPESYVCSINCLNLHNTVKPKSLMTKACQLTVISNIESLASSNNLSPESATEECNSAVDVQVKHHYIIKEKPHPDQRNVAVMCQPRKAVKSIQTTPEMKDASVQTQIEVHVPIYVPIPVPFPLPIPICLPILSNGTAKDIRDVSMVAGEKDNGRTCLKSDMQMSTDEEADGVYDTKPTIVNSTVEDDVANQFDKNGEATASTITENFIEKRKSLVQSSPDASMMGLKHTLGVTTLQRWIKQHADCEKPTRQVKNVETDILQLAASKLDYYLCSFVKEVQKPDGQRYAPDTIYYMCLGIQKYLFVNGRIDNIFYDPHYRKFTKCLDEVTRKFSLLFNDSQFITTRVTEEHLWESNQLGAHSPHVLLNTLLFFNKIHFNLFTLVEHFKLSFSDIIKCYQSNPSEPDANVSLRFYPPSQNNKRKRKTQQENKANPARCPVKLYDFYLSKCPESVKTGAFYLQPDAMVLVADDPVWFSTTPLSIEALKKMLHRLEMVREIIPFRTRRLIPNLVKETL